MSIRCSPELPHCILKAHTQAFEAFREAHRAPLPVRVRQHKVIEQVIEWLALDPYPEAIHVREVRLTKLAWLVPLLEKHFFRWTLERTPLLHPTLQRSKLPVLKLTRVTTGSNLNVVSGLDSKSDVSVGMNPWTGPRTRLERAGPRSGPAPSQTRRSGCRVPGHTPSVSTRGVGSADYPPVRIFAAIGTWRGELEERRSHKPGETFSRPNPTLSTPVFVNLRGASRDLPDQRSEFPMRGACRDPTQIHCVEHLASAG